MDTSKKNNTVRKIDLFIGLALVASAILFFYSQYKEQEHFAKEETSAAKYQYIFDKITLLSEKGLETSEIKNIISISMEDSIITNREFQSIKHTILVLENKQRKIYQLRENTEEELRKEIIKDELLLLK